MTEHFDEEYWKATDMIPPQSEVNYWQRLGEERARRQRQQRQEQWNRSEYDQPTQFSSLNDD